MDWPSPIHPELVELISTFRSRSKTISYHGTLVITSRVEELDKNWESIHIAYESKIHDEPSVQLTVWEDSVFSLEYRSRRRRTWNKLLFCIEEAEYDKPPDYIVEAFITTIKGLFADQICYDTAQWNKLKKQDMMDTVST